MTLQYRVQPLPAVWPGGKKTAIRRRAPFKSLWSRTLANLRREVAHLDGRDVVIHVDVDEFHIRLDGQLRADARPRSPGVVLSFRDGKGNRLEFPCDTFSYWQDNLDAIARAMEDLRRVDRYGVRSGRQYEGFKTLPDATHAVVLDASAAAVHLAQLAGESADHLLTDSAAAQRAIRKARSVTHPDAGGTDDAFTLVGRCKLALERHFGRSL